MTTTAPHVADLVLAVVERVVASAHGAYALAPRVCPLCGHPSTPRQEPAAALNLASAGAENLAGDTARGGERGGPVDGLDT